MTRSHNSFKFLFRESEDASDHIFEIVMLSGAMRSSQDQLESSACFSLFIGPEGHTFSNLYRSDLWVGHDPRPPRVIFLSGIYYHLTNYVFYCPIFLNHLIAFTSVQLHKVQIFGMYLQHEGKSLVVAKMDPSGSHFPVRVSLFYRQITLTRGCSV